eukprot:TRINITY_DN36683_c0_g1_i1.p1 TRINITY_DN36683_c0_g1~~TRINITY_DN36683_c0_g1_i1.p1  ORF type:complete len:488 (-),score=76.80 TRINITY_DN36683_c0_g1_i1:374-1837(-)
MAPRPSWQSRYACIAVAATSVFDLASSQVCNSNAGSANRDSSCNALEEVLVPFGETVLWALSLIPESCDGQTMDCHWFAAADSWRYVMGNLRALLDSKSEEELQALPVESIHALHNFVSQLGHSREYWFSNWLNAAGQTRQLVESMRPWLLENGMGKLALPRTDIGTKFPSFGRSVAIPTDGNKASTVTLANGFAMPVLGFGTWQIPADGTTYRSVLAALEEGYRHIDTAQAYRNEHEVGRALSETRVPRGEICLVTKLSDPDLYQMARKQFEKQLLVLGVDYIDIYMLHSPGRSMEDRKAAWQQLEELYDEGKIKALGVSNFDIPLLQELFSFARIRPVYIQNKYSIYQPGGHMWYTHELEADSLMEWLAKEGIVMTGYSIIHPAHDGYMSPMEDPHIKSIASRYGKTPSQVLHRWLLQLGAAVIPRSTKQERIRENSELFNFALSETDMRLINGIVSLLKSDTSNKYPPWVADVYGVGEFQIKMS